MPKRSIFNFLSRFVFGETCSICGNLFTSLGEYRKYSGGYYVCEKCIYSIPRSKNRALNIPFLDLYYSAFSYSGIGKEIFKLAKFEGVKHLLREIGKLADPFLSNFYKKINPDLVIPVPPHPFRLWWSRGYDPVVEMLQGTSLRNCVFPILKRNFVSFTPLSKVKFLEKRRKLVKGRFKLKDPFAVDRKRILIVDDVLTSGSTAAEIAKLLKSAGAKEVYLFTFFQRESNR